MTISLCMIVKDEEYFLPQCIESIKDIVSEIIIVDTGSKDKTVEIAQKYTNNIYFFPWQDDFSSARNNALKYTNYDLVIMPDADEQLSEKSKQPLKELINFLYNNKSNKPVCCSFKFINYENLYNKENYFIHFTPRLFNKKFFTFKGFIHNELTYNNIKNIEPEYLTFEDIIIHHYGYTKEVIALKNKPKRTLKLITKSLQYDPENPLYYFHIGMESIDPKSSIKAFERAINLWLKSNDKNYLLKIACTKIITIFLKQEKFDKAFQKIDEYKEFIEDQCDFWYELGCINLKIRKLDFAISCFEKALFLYEHGNNFYLTTTKEKILKISELLNIRNK